MQPLKGVNKRSMRDGNRKAGLGEYFNAREAFKTSSDPEKRLDAAYTMTQGHKAGSADFLSTAGAMFLELACDDAFSPEDKIDFIDRAQERLSLVMNHEANPHSRPLLDAGMYLANLGIFQAFALDVRPSRKILDDAYMANIDFAHQLRESSEQFREGSEPLGAIRGAQAELAVLGLLQRFEVAELQDGSWVATPSHYSEDNSVSRAGISRSWDISGYTSRDDDPYDLTYLLQIKSYRPTGDNPQRYNDDVTLVYPGHDLAFRSPSREHDANNVPAYPPFRMLDELIAEAYGDQSNVSLIERRTEKLHELIG